MFAPLCGKSLDLLHLRRLGHRVLGVELSGLAVEQFFAEHDLSPRISQRGGMAVWEAEGITLLQGDFFALGPDWLSGVGAVYDRAALVALPPDLQAAYAGRLLEWLPETAPMLLITLEYAQHDMPGPPFSTPASQVDRLYRADRRIELLEAVDALADNPRLMARGLSKLTEIAWRLRYEDE